MTPNPWSEEDLKQMRDLGLDPSEITRQLGLFRNPPVPLTIDRPASVGDGIRVLTTPEKEKAVHRWEEAVAQGRFLKFVPASGAATRMFHALLESLNRPELNLEDLRRESAEGSAESRKIVDFLDSLDRAAFYSELESALARQGLKLDELKKEGRIREILESLLFIEGLNSSQKPKALIPFHSYGSDKRTPIEEHLVEAALIVRDARGAGRVHYTVSEEHLADCEQLIRKEKERYEKRFGIRLEIGLSIQQNRTNTLAVDDHDDPFRDKRGRLVFRPSGHGALLQNLNDLGADLVYIKNIDNVTVESKLKPTLEWKKTLGGYLAQLQDRIFGCMRLLAGDVEEGEIENIRRFAEQELGVPLRGDFSGLPPGKRVEILKKSLDRPLRVCGVVPNTGEPGGGPFWVRNPETLPTLQIVESAQLDETNPEQRLIFSKSTHFNPVDLVCAVRDWKGKPYDLWKFSDPNAVFISRKSLEGRKLKALELPGLWNGAMARWNTVFVEVPLETFNPVKTVFDLLKPAHQG